MTGDTMPKKGVVSQFDFYSTGHLTQLTAGAILRHLGGK